MVLLSEAFLSILDCFKLFFWNKFAKLPKDLGEATSLIMNESQFFYQIFVPFSTQLDIKGKIIFSSFYLSMVKLN